MKYADWAVPAVSGLIAIGVSLGTLQAVASDSDDLSKRVQEIEIDLAQGESSKVMIVQNTKRLERLEKIVEKIADQQLKTAESIAAICASTGSNCPR